jgi:hypothetical protein
MHGGEFGTDYTAEEDMLVGGRTLSSAGIPNSFEIAHLVVSECYHWIQPHRGTRRQVAGQEAD